MIIDTDITGRINVIGLTMTLVNPVILVLSQLSPIGDKQCFFASYHLNLSLVDLIIWHFAGICRKLSVIVSPVRQ